MTSVSAPVSPVADPELTAATDAARYVADWLAFQGGLRGVPGIQAAIRYRGELLLDFAWGLADETTGEELTTTHLFRIASHSKTFTATAVMQLVERGRLRLDDTLAAWVPDLEASPLSSVTVRELLAHQGGIVRDGLHADYWQRGALFPARDELIRICRDEGKVYERNQYFKYSNIAYSLIGLIVEAASGQSYAEFTAENICLPMELSRTGAELDPARASEYAAGHTARFDARDERHRIPHVDTRAMAAATGWYSTAAETSAYLSAHLLGDDRLLSDDSKRQLQRRVSAVDVGGVERHYGLGFELRELDGADLVGHSGGYPGHITRTWLDPRTGLAVSVLTNAIDGPADALATGAMSILRLALANASAEQSTADIQGRYASLWTVLDVVDLGSATFTLSPAMPDPAAFAERVVVGEDGSLSQPAKASFGASGEPIEVVRDESGAVASVRWSGMSMWPIDEVRAAMDPAALDARREGMMSL